MGLLMVLKMKHAGHEDLDRRIIFICVIGRTFSDLCLTARWREETAMDCFSCHGIISSPVLLVPDERWRLGDAVKKIINDG